MTADPQDAVCQRLAARLVVLGRVEPEDAGDVLEILGLLPGQAIDAPTRLSTGFHVLDNGATVRARRAS